MGLVLHRMVQGIEAATTSSFRGKDPAVHAGKMLFGYLEIWKLGVFPRLSTFFPITKNLPKIEADFCRV